jgi:hypothetical protein
VMCSRAAIGVGGGALRRTSARHLAALGREPNMGDNNAVPQTQLWPRRAVGNCEQQTLSREARESLVSAREHWSKSGIGNGGGGAGSFIYHC